MTHHTEEPEDWDGCVPPYPEHDWTPGDLECRRCGADLSAWDVNE